LVVEGEMWLTVDDVERQLRCGDVFALEANIMHSERYGDEGAVYWAARRHVAGSAAQ
jgi:quercetin dioxygenase-like cupin family protein